MCMALCSARSSLSKGIRGAWVKGRLYQYTFPEMYKKYTDEDLPVPPVLTTTTATTVEDTMPHSSTSIKQGDIVKLSIPVFHNPATTQDPPNANAVDISEAVVLGKQFVVKAVVK